MLLYFLNQLIGSNFNWQSYLLLLIEVNFPTRIPTTSFSKAGQNFLTPYQLPRRVQLNSQRNKGLLIRPANKLSPDYYLIFLYQRRHADQLLSPDLN
jgi:hypothetical protein